MGSLELKYLHESHTNPNRLKGAAEYCSESEYIWNLFDFAYIVWVPSATPLMACQPGINLK